MIIEFDGRGDILSGFETVSIEMTVNFENASDGAGEFIRDVTEFEVEIESIETHSDDITEQSKKWFVKDGDKYRSFFDEIHNRCVAHVSDNLDSYYYD